MRRPSVSGPDSAHTASTRNFAVLALLATALSSFAPAPSSAQDSAAPSGGTPNSLAAIQGLQIESQAGRPGFPAKPVAVGSRVSGEPRAPVILGQSTVEVLVDEVPYSAKSHVTVRYGATIFEQRVGPVEIGSTYLLPYSETVVLGAEALLEPIEADEFLLQFGKGTTQPPFALIVRRRGAPPLVFDGGLADDFVATTVQSSLLALSQADPIIPGGQLDRGSFVHLSGQETDGQGVIRIPAKVDRAAPVESFHLIFKAVKDEPIVLDYAGFVSNKPAAAVVSVTATGAERDGPARLEIVDEHGVLTTVEPDQNGRFVFPRPRAPTFSATFRTTNSVGYFAAGRWLSASQQLEPAVVIEPDYVNSGGETNELAVWQRSIKLSRLQSLYTQTFAPHTRAWWGGAANKMTRFRGEVFYNNIGFHDIDAVPQNADQCIVGVYYGESVVEARQMRLYRKASTILGELLSVKLGRCVLVHAMASGRSVQSYEDIRRAWGDLHPKFMMFEMSPSLFLYMTPTFQRHFFGYGEGASPVATMTFDAQGHLQYLPPSPKWRESLVPPSPVLESGGQLASAFLLSEKDAPPEANRAWQVFEATLRQYRAEMPDALFVIDGLYERAACLAQDGCGPHSLLAIGSTVATGGATFFEDRLVATCARVLVVCGMAKRDAPGAIFKNPMLYENDFHYTGYGNDWAAHELARDLAAALARHLAAAGR
jgi:hypothetical protein